MDRCIIHYDSISTASTLCEVTVTLLSTLQKCKAIRENLGGDICTMNRVMVFQKFLTSSIIIIPSVSKNMFMLRHLKRGKKISVHVNC